jgi:protein-S-isoprenylcysteine O-methyltransferase Ste14
MKPLLAHDATVKALLFASLAVLIAGEFVVRRRFSGRGSSSREWTIVFMIVVIALTSVAAIYAVNHDVAVLPGGPWWPVVVGLVLMWLGSLLRMWSMVTLGRFFQLTLSIQDDHRIVERGPYRWLRHPSYLGIIVSLAGIGFVEGNWVSLAAMSAGGVIAVLVRIPVEERLLLGELGERYASYAHRTARLLPGLY